MGQTSSSAPGAERYSTTTEASESGSPTTVRCGKLTAPAVTACTSTTTGAASVLPAGIVTTAPGGAMAWLAAANTSTSGDAIDP